MRSTDSPPVASAIAPETNRLSIQAWYLVDALDGEDVVPGFSFPVSEVFADPLT